MQEMCRKKKEKNRLNCDFIGFKNGRLNYRCKECKKPYTKLTNESMKDFTTLYKFCNGDLGKFFLLLRKGTYRYEYMDSWERSDENTIPPKEAFYSKLNLEVLAMQTMSMLEKYGKYLKQKILVSIMIYMFNVIHYCLQMYLKTLELSVLK